MNDAPNARDLNLSHVGKRTAYKLGFRAGLAMADPMDDERVLALVRLCGLYFGGLSSNANAGGVYARDIRAALAAIEAQP